jgi:spore germination protein YaaH
MKINTKLLTLLISFFIFLSINNPVFGTIKKNPSPPSIPQKLTITKISTSEIDLKWNVAIGANGYKIYRGDPKGSNFVLIGKTSGTTFKNIKLKSSTSYWYYIKSYNSYGTSGASNRLKAVTKKNSPKPATKVVLGFATDYYTGDVSSYNSLIKNSPSINQVVTATYTTNSTGELSGTAPVNQIAYANKNNINTMAMVSNNFDGEIAKSILENSINRNNLINNILLSMINNNYKGVNIDIEGIYPSDRNYFSTFLKELYNKLHPQGFIVTISVPAETIDNPKNSWNGAFDYAQISKYANTIVLMTYDEHSPGSNPGPVASIGWVNAVVNYATTVIPKNNILLGVAAYGYDWSSLGTKAYGISGINNLASKYKAKIMWDSISQCPYFIYTDENKIVHNVWFENSTSLGYKLDVVNSLNLSGVAIWRLGLEDPGFWTTIKTKFNK